MKINKILSTDSYKYSHYLQYPPGTETVSSYIEARGGAFSHTLFFGLQAYIKEYLLEPITLAEIDEAEQIVTEHGLLFNHDGWMHILNRHNGYMPVEISAVPEGSIIPTGNVLLQVENTDRELPWVVSFMETALLRAVWYPSSVATTSLRARLVIEKYLKETAESAAEKLPFALHDFGARGVSSQESAALGGLAHLVCFRGTDTAEALAAARAYYAERMAGKSIPAAEHSTITSWERHGERAAYENLITKFAGPGKMYAGVSDSYDIFNACETIWGTTLKAHVETAGGRLVVRPDSGDPEIVVLRVLEILAEKFGSTVNSLGYRVLADCVRVIQGDGMDFPAICGLLALLKHTGWSTENVAFGMGGGLLQKVDRDTYKWAMKCSAIKRNGMWHDVYKDPVTDPGKTSKRGVLALTRNKDGDYETVRRATAHSVDLLQPVYKNGRLLTNVTLAQVRAQAEACIETDLAPSPATKGRRLRAVK